MKSFRPLWAVRPDFLMPIHRAFAEGREVDVTSENHTRERQRIMTIFDTMPREVRAWIHENGSTFAIVKAWYQGERRTKALIKAGETRRDAFLHQSSVLLNDPQADAEEFLKELGL